MKDLQEHLIQSLSGQIKVSARLCLRLSTLLALLSILLTGTWINLSIGKFNLPFNICLVVICGLTYMTINKVIGIAATIFLALIAISIQVAMQHFSTASTIIFTIICFALSIGFNQLGIYICKHDFEMKRILHRIWFFPLFYCITIATKLGKYPNLKRTFLYYR